MSLLSDYGVARSVSRAELASLLVAALIMPPLTSPAESAGQEAARLQLAAVRVLEGESGAIQLTSVGRMADMAQEGRVSCVHCGRFVVGRTGGLEWHLKTAHGLQLKDHRLAAAVTLRCFRYPPSLPRPESTCLGAPPRGPVVAPGAAVPQWV